MGLDLQKQHTERERVPGLAPGLQAHIVFLALVSVCLSFFGAFERQAKASASALLPLPRGCRGRQVPAAAFLGLDPPQLSENLRDLSLSCLVRKRAWSCPLAACSCSRPPSSSSADS